MSDRITLPHNLNPSHYSLSLTDLDFEAWTYKGTVSIDLEITQNTKDIVLNATEINFINSKLHIGNGDATQTIRPSGSSLQKDADTLTISFDQELPVAQPCKLDIEFEGSLNSDSTGFYRAQYKALSDPPASVARSSHGSHYMLCTQFQAVGARRAFPCFDEPNIKATFSLDIEIPEDQVAISNTPVKYSHSTSQGRKLVAFEETPVMSTYLLAWAVGDFKYVETTTVRKYRGDNIPVRLYVTAGLEQQGHFAVEEAANAIDFFSETFGIDYPLAKMDLLAVPEFSFGAMENWGLITGKPFLLLFDEKTSSANRKEIISSVIAHEVAHQWFGNLVTMDWWDELWLNEGFATWASNYAVDHLHPEWKIWEGFLSREMEAALARDAMRSSHPIHAHVPDARNVHEVFDMISYQKSCAVLNMLANHMGVEKMLSGVAHYLKQNMHRNATAEDLWRALGEVSGDDIVTSIKPWIEKIGYPVLTVDEAAGQLILKQSRFLASGDMKPEEDETVWWIPLGCRNVYGEEDASMIPALTQKQQSIPITAQDALYLFNSSATGFYRVEYAPGHLTRLGAQLDSLTTLEKLTIMGSSSALAFIGQGSTVSLLSFLQAFARETYPQIWLRMMRDFTRLRSRFDNDADMSQAIKNLTLAVIGDMMREVGWERAEGEKHSRGQLRVSVLTEGLYCDSREIMEVALQRVASYGMEPETLRVDPGLRRVVWSAVAKSSPKDAVPDLLNQWQKATSSELKLHYIDAIGITQDPEVIQNIILPFCYGTTPEDRVLTPTAMRPLVSCLAAGAVSRQLQWKYIKANWDAVAAKMGTPDGISRLLNVALVYFNDAAAAEDIGQFFADKDTNGYAMAVDKAKDSIMNVSRYRERERASLATWLKEQGYMKSP